MVATPPLFAFNHLPMWRRQASAWGNRFAVASFDRLLYVFLHRIGWMGREERLLLEQRIHPGMHVVDVGANIGLYTLLFSRLVGKSGRVTALEPDPVLFELLEKNCVLNSADNVTLFNVGAGAFSGSMTLTRSFINSGDNRMGAKSATAPWRSVEVAVKSIDELLAGAHLDFLKIDVQGWEGEVLKGMKEVLACNPAIQISFEFWPAGLRSAGCDPVGLLCNFSELGFRIYSESRTLSAPITDFSNLSSSTGNGYAKYVQLLAVREHLEAHRC